MTRPFGFESTTDQVLEGIDLSGKRALVTGASGGLGAETARALASRGASVTVTARDTAKGESVAESIRAAGGDAEVRELELSVPDSVRAFAKSYAADYDALHILINNAGVMACPLARTAEGWEMQFATCHLGHFLLTNLLLPLLEKGAPARVVNVSSAGHRFSPVRLDDPHFEKGAYDKWEAYGQAKSANILFGLELTRRHGDQGITSNAVHPGGIMTDLGRHLQEDDIKELMSRAPSGGIRWKEVASGAATQVWAATAPELEGRGGLYLEDCHVGIPRAGDDATEGYEAHAVDSEAAARLWTLSEEILGERF